MNQFVAPKRRLELKGVVNDISVYDDFAHHPTAIETTLAGLRARVGQAKIWAVLEPRSNTMRMGVHKSAIADSLHDANEVLLFEPANSGWSLTAVAEQMPGRAQVFQSVELIVAALVEKASAGDHIVIMSNGGFGGIHDKLISALRRKWEH